MTDQEPTENWYGNQLEDLNTSRNITNWEVQKLRDIEEAAPELSAREPSTLDTATAAFSLYNPITSYIVNESLPEVPYIEGYNPIDDIEGYERYWQAFVDSNNPETTAVIKRRIDNQMRNRQILQNSDDITSIASTVAAGFADPFNLALMMVPGAAFVKQGQVAVSAARSAGIGAVATGLSEAALYNTQETRTVEESLTNLAATAAVDAILGAGASRWMTAEKKLEITQQVEEMLASPQPAGTPLSAGAAEVMGTATGAPIKKTSLFFEATGLGALGRQAMKITPLGRTILNENQRVRQIAQEMAEIAVQVEGDFTPNAVETLIKADLRRTDIDIAKGRKLQKESGMNADDFSVAVTQAQRRGDTSSNVQAQQLAEYLRPKMDKMWQRAAEARIPGAFREVRRYPDYERPAVRLEKTGGDTYRVFDADTGEEVGFTTISDKSGRVSLGPDVKKGYGQSVYIEAKKMFPELEVRSGAELSPDAERMWERLVDSGEAKKTQIGTSPSGEPEYSYTIPADQKFSRTVKGTAGEPDIFIEPVESHTAQSFLRRVYDINKVRENPAAFREAWKKGLIERQQRHNASAQQRLDDAIADGAPKARINEIRKEIRAIDDDFMARLDEAVIDIDEKVRNLRPGDLHYTEVAPGSGMFKGRVDILDEFVEDFLVDDWERLYEGYTKNLSSRIHLAERFGDGDGDFMMQGTLQRLRESYNVERVRLEEAGEVKAADRVTKQAERAERDLKYLRDSLLGLLHNRAYGDERNIFLTSMLRTARHFNVATKLNSVLTASIPDMARIVTYNGGRDLAPAMVKALKALPLSSVPDNELMEMVQAAERVSSVRLRQFSEVDDAMPLSKAENFNKVVSDKAMTISGIKHWNALWKGVVAGMVNNRIVKAVKGGNSLPWLRSVGFTDDMAETVRRQVNRHATYEDGMWNMNLDRWDDVGAIEAVESAAIKEADRVVLTPGVGDKPIFMSTEAGATMLQFKSFLLASMNRLLMPLMQETGGRKWAEIMSLIGLGGFTYWLRETLAGREPSEDPAVILREAVDRSGLAAYGLEFYNTFNKLAGHPFGDVPARYRSRDWVGAIAGPTAGTMSDTFKILNVNSSPDTRVHALRKLLPLQNHFLLAKPLTVIEGEAAKAVGGTGKYAEPRNIGAAVEGPPPAL